MKILKKTFCILLIMATMLYMPTIAKATETEKIQEEFKNYISSSTTIDLNMNSRTVKTFNQTITRAANIAITRSSKSAGISLGITQNSGYTVSASVFTSDGSTVIGSIQYVPNNTYSSCVWTSSELGSYTNVLIFLTCYKDVTYTAYGSITY